MQTPPTETLKASEARAGWAALLNRVFRRQAHVVIEKSGIPVAVLISPREYAWFQTMLAQRARDFEAIERLRAAFADVPDDEIEREVDHALAEVRAERRTTLAQTVTGS